MMIDRGMNMMDALKFVRSKRSIAEPNPGFLMQLKAFERVIFGTLNSMVITSKQNCLEEVEGDEADSINQEEPSMTKEITDGI